MKIIRVIFQNIQLLITKWWFSFRKRKNNIWVFGEWFGDICGDNCFYFVKYLSENHPNLEIYWVAKPSCDTSKLPSDIKVLEMDSPLCVKVLKKAGVVFAVQTWCDFSDKSNLYWSGALFVNFWHGAPWKIIGGDCIKSKASKFYAKYLASKFEADVYLSTSAEFDKIFQRSYYVDNSRIIKAGYPRNSIFYDKSHLPVTKHLLISHLKTKGYDVDDDVKVITYMPTFRDNNSDVFSFNTIYGNTLFKELINKYNVVIIEKAHFVSRENNINYSEYNNKIINLYNYPTQELLAASDILITDYSSCFFDYLILDRPIIHYLYDYDYYANNDRGLYYDKDDVACGDIAFDVDQLIKCIRDNIKDPTRNAKLRAERREKYMRYETANSCEKIYADLLKRIDEKFS